jgi:glycerophosphoryl diester phosphodiesterase
MIFSGRPSVVGHRGLGAGAPAGHRENSVSSFLAAAQAGVHWVELDVRRSSDDALVLWHDPVTPGGHRIVARTAAELAAEGIVPLDDVLAALPADIGVDIDVKTTIEDAVDAAGRRTHALVAGALRRHAGTRQFLVSSFDASVPGYLARPGHRTGDFALGLITEANFAAGHAVSAAANLGLDAVCLNTETLNVGREPATPAGHSAEQILEIAHRAGLEVMVWSPDPPQAAALARAGADALCVNDIPGVQAVLAGR